jgi:hypothetical protein
MHGNEDLLDEDDEDLEEEDDDDEEGDDDELDDDDEDDDESSSSGKMLQRKHKNRNNYNFEYNGEILRGSRTNCKGHWSKEEVSYFSLFFHILLNFLPL